MTKILELLKNAKVEWKKLWEVTIWDKNFQGVEEYKQKEVRKYHYYMAGELKDLISKDGKIKILTTSKSDLYSNEIDVKENIISEEIICIPSGGNPIVQYYNGKFITGDNRIATSFDIRVLDNKFLYYYMENNIDLIASFYQGAGIKHPDMKKVLDISIPLPPIELQKEIVHILDTFSELIAELQIELTLRKKQYEYYLNMLLSEEYLKEYIKRMKGEKDYKLKNTTLEKIGTIKMCKRILKNQTSSFGEVPFYKIGTFGKKADSFISKKLFDEYKQKYSYPKKGEVLISVSGTIGRTVIFDGEDSYFQDSNIIWLSHDEKIVLNKYLYYLYQIINWKVSIGGTINRLYNYSLINTEIVVPPLEIQEKVVKVLDKFQELIGHTKGALPEEIELRQKQYEYYREMLLKETLIRKK